MIGGLMRWIAVILVFGLAAFALANPPAVLVPTYSAQYRDDILLREILAELRAIRAELRAARQVAPAPPASPKALFSARCASCHGVAVADKQGLGFVLIDSTGNVPPLSLVEKRRILREVESDRMPKDRLPLSELEKKYLKEQFFPADQ